MTDSKDKMGAVLIAEGFAVIGDAAHGSYHDYVMRATKHEAAIAQTRVLGGTPAHEELLAQLDADGYQAREPPGYICKNGHGLGPDDRESRE